jgi:hypothetical protein
MVQNGIECIYVPYFTETNEFLLAYTLIFSPKKIYGNSPVKEKQRSYRHNARDQSSKHTPKLNATSVKHYHRNTGLIFN